MNLSGKSIFVTGAYGGFLGTHLTNALLARGARVHTVRSCECDLTKPGEALEAMQEVRPEVVVHCAAKVGGIGANLAQPADFIHDNLAMGLNVIKAANDAHVKKICVVGTTCSYPSECSVPFKPGDFHNGYPEISNAPYGIAKRTLLTVLEAYEKQHGLRFVYPVLANLFGPGECFEDSRSHVVAALIKKFVAAQESDSEYVEVWGDGQASRELLYVVDAAKAIADLVASGSGFHNIGSGIEITVFELARQIAVLVGYKGKILFDPSCPSGQRKRRLLTVDRVLTTPLVAGLQKTIDWWREEKSRVPSCDSTRLSG